LNDIEKSRVYVGIGSNIDPVEHIKKCIKALNDKFDDLKLSPTYESSSMGFEGPNFYNLAAFFKTKYDVVELKKILNQIETINGRSLDEVKFSSRTLDIDILYFDNLIDAEMNIPRGEITKFDFVLRPLYDLNPAHIHPITKKTHHRMINETAYQKMIVKQIDINYTL
tara:strand:+ start:426 stop:929 length:504 start_codon:yes stop_codon:yes gene_type:complete